MVLINPDVKAAFTNAYDAYAEPLFRHCYFRLYNRERAREVAQEAFLRTWDELAKGGVMKNIRAFLYRVATNLVIDEMRRKKAGSLDQLHEQGFDPHGDDHPAEKIAEKFDLEHIKKILSQLDPIHQEIITLSYFDHLSIAEIADVLNITINSVSVRLHRALKKLKKKLGAYER